MSPCRPAHRSSDAETAEGGAGASCRRRGVPLPLKALAVGGAFLASPPLGIAALTWVLLREGGRRAGFEAPWGRRGFAPGWRRGAWSTGNSAFDAERAETLRRMEEEAEAFTDFRRRDREARDREVFARFRAERAAPSTAPASEGEAAG